MIVVKIGVIFFCFIILLYGLMYFMQEKFVFRATKLPENYSFNFKYNFDELFFSMPDGKKINALLFKSENSKGLVFYLHGNADALNYWGDIAPTYTQHDHDILIIDYRGYGKSEGNIKSEQQLYDDIQHIYKQMCNSYNEKDIVVIGYSIGSGIASHISATNNPGRLILLSPYFSLESLAQNHYPFFPKFLIRYKFPTNKNIPKIKCPITLFHGKNDALIPAEHSKNLIKLCKPEDELFLLNNQIHGGMNDNEVFKEKLKELLKINPQ